MPTNFYISNHLRNSESRKKNDRRISSIMQQIRFMSQQDQQPQKNYDSNINGNGFGGSRSWNKKLDQIDILSAEFKGFKNVSVNRFRRGNNNNYNNRKSRENRENREKKYSFGGLETIVDDDCVWEQGQKECKRRKNRVYKSSVFRDQSQRGSKKSLDKVSSRYIKHRNSNSSTNPHQPFVPPKPNSFPTPKYCKTPRPFFSYTTFKPSKRIPKKPTPIPSSTLLPHPPPSLQPPHLQHQNIHKLNQFIKGGYDSQLHQYTDIINLSQIDRYRKNYYIYERIYDQMVENNIENKMVLKDCKRQCFRDVVFVNQMKLHATAPEFVVALEQLRIIR